MDRLVEALRSWLSAIRTIPRILTFVLWVSVISGLGLAWFWFLSRDLALVRWLAVPWLAAVAVPQFALWLLSASLRDLLELPDRLLALKTGLADQGQQVLERIGRLELDDRPRRGFLRTLRDAYALHGELGQIVATRAILRRFTGRLAVLIGPVALLLNGALILVAFIQLVVAAS